MNGQDCLEAQECRGDFWIKLEEAYEKAGGGIPIERAVKMPFGEMVAILAQNGIRMTYNEDWHISKIGNR
jgi:hypothetical protein